MESFGNVLAYVVVEIIMLIQGTLAAWVDITAVDGNITSISLTSSGEAFCLNWSNFIVSFAGSMNNMMAALWTVR
jgi:hypothetical protein